MGVKTRFGSLWAHRPALPGGVPPSIETESTVGSTHILRRDSSAPFLLCVFLIGAPGGVFRNQRNRCLSAFTPDTNSLASLHTQWVVANAGDRSQRPVLSGPDPLAQLAKRSVRPVCPCNNYLHNGYYLGTFVRQCLCQSSTDTYPCDKDLSEKCSWVRAKPSKSLQPPTSDLLVVPSKGLHL
jgi:hypothetical protein